MAHILDGSALSEKLTIDLKKKVSSCLVTPKLVIIQVGDHKESNTYIKKKTDFAEKIGVTVKYEKYLESVKVEQVISDIQKYNIDPNTHGIMVQLPVPGPLDANEIIEAIDPAKDVDGLTAKNTKKIFDNTEAFMPAATKSIITLLNFYNIDVQSKKVVIVGESALVGRPTALAFLNRQATVTVCHSQTKNLEVETKQADILIVGVGQPNLITERHVSKDQVVIDVGINVMPNKKVVGDVDFTKVKDIVSAITPVPGGVGPMTVFSLFENLLEACTKQA